jgi:hypothetical protein
VAAVSASYKRALSRFTSVPSASRQPFDIRDLEPQSGLRPRLNRIGRRSPWRITRKTPLRSMPSAAATSRVAQSLRFTSFPHRTLHAPSIGVCPTSHGTSPRETWTPRHATVRPPPSARSAPNASSRRRGRERPRAHRLPARDRLDSWSDARVEPVVRQAYDRPNFVKGEGSWVKRGSS